MSLCNFPSLSIPGISLPAFPGFSLPSIPIFLPALTLPPCPLD